jgi:NAD(P)H-flavin reductase
MPGVNQYAGRITEFRLEPDGGQVPRIGCPPQAIPQPGQYLLADSPGDRDSILSTVLFPQQILDDGIVAAPTDRRFPDPDWTLGSSLLLRGPLGRGFQLPISLRNLVLGAAGESAARLLPLMRSAENVALFTDAPLPALPPEVEVQPLAGLSEALAWADFMVLDLPGPQVNSLGYLDRLREQIGQAAFPRPGQALLAGPMPCGGIADCGVCAVRTRRRYRLSCKDGPVFQINELAS